MSAPTAHRRSGPPRTAQAQAQPGVHVCPGIGCRTLVPPGLIACRYHWLLIPRPDRAALGAAFRQRESNPPLFALAVATAKQLIDAHDPRKDPA
jgi:hypothetical protein